MPTRPSPATVNDCGMTRRGLLMTLSATSLAVSTGACDLVGGGSSYRFRMTVEADTPQGVQTGSSVMEVRVSRGMAIGDNSGVSSSLRGEAVVVDLPDGPIFALLKLPDAGPPLQEVVSDALTGEHAKSTDGIMQQFGKLGSTWFSEYKADLPRRRDIGISLREDGADDSNWPMMVRFRDLNDPKSVEAVDPEAVGVKRIRLETTGDDVTTGLKKRLPWLDHLERYRTDPTNPFTNVLPTGIGYLRSGKL